MRRHHGFAEVDPRLRNDLGLLVLVELGSRGPRRIEAVPLKLDYCNTRLAERAGRILLAASHEPA